MGALTRVVLKFIFLTVGTYIPKSTNVTAIILKEKQCLYLIGPKRYRVIVFYHFLPF